MQLALGTAQFGLRYGVAGRDQPVPEDEVREILLAAARHGIMTLDTAHAYGDIEERLSRLMQGLSFSVVTKLPACPADLPADAAGTWVAGLLKQMRERMGPALKTVLFHSAEDLLDGARAEALWQACTTFADAFPVKLGVSTYEVETLERVRRRFPISIAQLPANALDQRLRARVVDPDIEIHVRSVFLQGLLLMPEAEAVRRVPAAASDLARWHAWCRTRVLSPIVAALGLAKGLPANACVVGVDSLVQFEKIMTAWADAPVLAAPELRSDNLEIIDPRRWPRSQDQPA